MSGVGPTDLPPSAPRGLLALTAVVVLATAGVLPLGLSPQIVDGLMSSGMSASRAAFCISVNIGSGLFGALAVYFARNRIGPRALGVSALALIAVGNWISYVAQDFTGVFTGQLVAGLGAGVTTVSFRLLSQSRRPARNFAIYAAVSIVSTAAVGWASAPLVKEHGAGAIFVILAVSAVLSLPAMTALPLPRSATSDIAAHQLTRSQVWNRVRTCVMMICFFSAFGGLWPFIGALGPVHGLDAVTTSQQIAEGVLVGGLAGSALTVVLERRVASLTTLRLLMPAQAAVLALLVATTGGRTFLAGNVALNVGEYMFFAFNMSLLAELDSSGRFAMLGSVVQTLGFSLGPALAGALVNTAGVAAIIPYCAAGYALTFIGLLTIRTSTSG